MIPTAIRRAFLPPALQRLLLGGLTWIFLSQIVLGQHPLRCNIFQYENDHVGGKRLAAVQTFDAQGNLLSEIHTNYISMAGTGGDDWETYCTYDDTLLIEKLLVEKNGDEMKWIYQYNIDHQLVREECHRFKKYLKPEYAGQRGCLTPPEFYEPEKRRGLAFAYAYKYNEIGQCVERRVVQGFITPWKIVYRYHPHGQLLQETAYPDSNFKYFNVTKYKYPPYQTIQTTSRDSFESSGISSVEHVVKRQFDDLHRLRLETVRIGRDKYDSFRTTYEYEGLLLKQEVSFMEFRNEYTPGHSEKRWVTSIYEYED